jgi:hypothetical protein
MRGKPTGVFSHFIGWFAVSMKSLYSLVAATRAESRCGELTGKLAPRTIPIPHQYAMLLLLLLMMVAA